MGKKIKEVILNENFFLRENASKAVVMCPYCKSSQLLNLRPGKSNGKDVHGLEIRNGKIHIDGSIPFNCHYFYIQNGFFETP